MQTYMMQELFTHIKELPDSDLVTRELGAKAYSVLKQEFIKSKPGALFILDFTGVLVMDSSFAGTSILKLMRELIDGKYGERYVCLSKITPSTGENVDLTIKGHGLKLAIPVIQDNAMLYLLGELEPNLLLTFDIVSSRLILTARELADQEKIGINAASNRLKKLYDLHLISRTEEVTIEGKQHRYKSLLV